MADTKPVYAVFWRKVMTRKSISNRRHIWLNSEYVLFRDLMTDELSIYTIGRDISEVPETRDKAADALAQLMLLQELAKVGFWFLDVEGGSIFLSEEGYRAHAKDPVTLKPKLDQGLDFCLPKAWEKAGKNAARMRKKRRRMPLQAQDHYCGWRDCPGGIFGLARQGDSVQVKRIIGVFRAVA